MSDESPAKKARKPRAPRKKKESPFPVVEQDAAPAVVAEQESTHAADTDDTAERAAMQEEANGRPEAGIVNLPPAIVNQPTPDVDPDEVNGNGHELRGARPRANGDRPWAFDRTDLEHAWERLETADGRIAFRFKNEPTDEQMSNVDDGFVPSEGKPHLILPWNVNLGILKPVSFKYVLPNSGVG